SIPRGYRGVPRRGGPLRVPPRREERNGLRLQVYKDRLAGLDRPLRRAAESLANLIGRRAVRDHDLLSRIEVAGLGSLGARDGDLDRRVYPEGHAADDVVQERGPRLDHGHA